MGCKRLGLKGKAPGQHITPCSWRLQRLEKPRLIDTLRRIWSSMPTRHSSSLDPMLSQNLGMPVGKDWEISELSSHVSFILVIKFPEDLLCQGVASSIRNSTYANITGPCGWFPVSPLCSPRPSLHPPAFSFGFSTQESASVASIPFPFTAVLSSIQLLSLGNCSLLLPSKTWMVAISHCCYSRAAAQSLHVSWHPAHTFVHSMVIKLSPNHSGWRCHLFPAGTLLRGR